MYCGISPMVLWRAIKEKRLPAYRVRGYRIVLLKEKELRRWLEENLEPYELSLNMREQRG